MSEKCSPLLGLQTIPNIYIISGVIWEGGESTGTGQATIVIDSTGFVTVNFALMIVESQGDSTMFNYGLNSELFTKINSNIPKITSLGGGFICIIGSANDALVNGYGAYFIHNKTKTTMWTPARIYTETGAGGVWSANVFHANDRIFGTCYGIIDNS